MRIRTIWLPALALLAATALFFAGCSSQQAPMNEEAPPAKAETAKPPREKKPTVKEETAMKPSTSVTKVQEEKAPMSPTASTAEVKPPAATAMAAPAFKVVYFEFDKSVLTPEAQDALKYNRDYLLANPDVRIMIEGHCDERGTNEYNLALGERRANAARRFLADLGIDPNRMEVISYGEERPADPASTEAAWAKNRRAEFKKTN